uniref:Double jelly roll-like domain-containing protein n=1 Tax=Cacopsylla melanoneura TaxID=428564 RepID=A0A8D9EWX1_9HEMI
MNNILSINTRPSFDETITRREIHSYAPYSSITVDSADNIVISINQEDIYLLLSESSIYLEGAILKADGTAFTAGESPEFINNGICFLFEEIRLEMNGFEVETCKNPGITSCMKGYVSYSENEIKKLNIRTTLFVAVYR